MKVELAKWGNSAAVRVPALALSDAGFRIGQCFDLRVEQGRMVLEPAAESLDDLLLRMTPQSRHTALLEDEPRGAEAW
jgi:antitoxin MazE